MFVSDLILLRDSTHAPRHPHIIHSGLLSKPRPVQQDRSFNEKCLMGILFTDTLLPLQVLTNQCCLSSVPQTRPWTRKPTTEPFRLTEKIYVIDKKNSTVKGGARGLFWLHEGVRDEMPQTWQPSHFVGFFTRCPASRYITEMFHYFVHTQKTKVLQSWLSLFISREHDIMFTHMAIVCI